MSEPQLVQAVAVLGGIAGFLTGLAAAAVGRLFRPPPPMGGYLPGRPQKARPLDQQERILPRTPETARKEEGVTQAATAHGRQTPLHEEVKPKAVVVEPRAPRGQGQGAPKRARTPQSGNKKRQTATKVARPVVRPVSRPYWDLRRWTLEQGRLKGFYQTPYGSYEGEIAQPKSPHPQFFIKKPPRALKEHDHWVCFHAAGNNTYRIHFSPKPKHPDEGILAVERVLIDALSGKRRSHV